jgi:hypothetical protein
MKQYAFTQISTVIFFFFFEWNMLTKSTCCDVVMLVDLRAAFLVRASKVRETLNLATGFSA